MTTPPARPEDRPAGRLAEEWRLVPMSRAQRDWLKRQSAVWEAPDCMHPEAEVAAAWDAAPDAAEAVSKALRDLYGLPRDPPSGELDGITAARYERVNVQSQAVLVALLADTPTTKTGGDDAH